MPDAHETPLLPAAPQVPEDPSGALSLRAGDTVARALRTPPHAIYDTLADWYDARYLTEHYQRENDEVAAIIKRFVPITPDLRVLDVGAGTGLAVEIGVTAYPNGYTAVEPSAPMLSRLLDKFPEARPINEAAAGIPKNLEFDVALALFGAASYFTPRELRHLARLTRRNHATAIVMTYADGYYPDYYATEPPQAPIARRALTRLARMRGATFITSVSGNYDVWVIQ